MRRLASQRLLAPRVPPLSPTAAWLRSSVLSWRFFCHMGQQYGAERKRGGAGRHVGRRVLRFFKRCAATTQCDSIYERAIGLGRRGFSLCCPVFLACLGQRVRVAPFLERWGLALPPSLDRGDARSILRWCRGRYWAFCFLYPAGVSCQL